ncbi:TetR/AcrR family transcriptional regulator [Faucicola boevrei]|uniref:TetR/AcrR family transcriptional regulator n=1 Tax=Faucicola boevrei TaxID=346665 RepID=UPI000369F4A0|nr:TetR/AcrR family transcriptional regulator [Moraxella boevrei]
MPSSYDEKIDNVLADSELARRLVPNKFKFTSQQGRKRRQKLLAAAKELSATRPIAEITLADVCDKAGIPRASAYHFFPNVSAIFLALRFLNTSEILKKLEALEVGKYSRWSDYLAALIEAGVEAIQADPTVARLIYETDAPAFENNEFGSEMEKQITQMIYEKLASQFKVPNFDGIHKQMLVGYGIVNGVLQMAYRSEGKISESYRREATSALLAYLRNYIPENLSKNQ